MRRVAVLSDVHGNLPALRAVLAELAAEPVDVIVVGGDVAAGPLPAETLDALLALGPVVRWVRGNADRELVDPPPGAEVAAWAAARLSPGQRAHLAGLPTTVTLSVEGLGPVCFCHGTPRSDEEIVTRITPDARLAAILAGIPERVVVGGHTHQQFDRVVGGHRFVNAGSVGMPYEGDAAAFWLRLGPGVTLRRTPYDVAAAVAELRAGGLPDVDETVLRESLLEPADPAWVARFFEEQATA